MATDISREKVALASAMWAIPVSVVSFAVRDTWNRDQELKMQGRRGTTVHWSEQTALVTVDAFLRRTIL
jgi:hypothetical protein